MHGEGWEIVHDLQKKVPKLASFPGCIPPTHESLGMRLLQSLLISCNANLLQGT